MNQINKYTNENSLNPNYLKELENILGYYGDDSSSTDMTLF